MLKIPVYLILFLFPILLCGCEDDSGSLPIQFELRLINEEGNIATSFNTGENFLLSFLIINNSDKMVNLISFETEDFLKVFMLTQSDGEVSIGKPYSAIFCEYRLGNPISPKDTLKLERLWITPDSLKNSGKFNNSVICGYGDNVSLSRGSYTTRFKTAFEFSIDGEEFSTPEQHFEIDFNYN